MLESAVHLDFLEGDVRLRESRLGLLAVRAGWTDNMVVCTCVRVYVCVCARARGVVLRGASDTKTQKWARTSAKGREGDCCTRFGKGGSGVGAGKWDALGGTEDSEDDTVGRQARP